MNDAYCDKVSNPYTLFEYYPSSDTVNNDYDADQWVSNGSNNGNLTYDSSENTLSLNVYGNGDNTPEKQNYQCNIHLVNQD